MAHLPADDENKVLRVKADEFVLDNHGDRRNAHTNISTRGNLGENDIFLQKSNLYLDDSASIGFQGIKMITNLGAKLIFTVKPTTEQIASVNYSGQTLEYELDQIATNVASKLSSAGYSANKIVVTSGSGNITTGGDIADYITTSSTSILTNKTLTSPKIGDIEVIDSYLYIRNTNTGTIGASNILAPTRALRIPMYCNNASNNKDAFMTLIDNNSYELYTATDITQIGSDEVLGYGSGQIYRFTHGGNWINNSLRIGGSVTSTPTDELEVYGSSNTTLRIEADGTITNDGAFLYLKPSGTGSAQIKFKNRLYFTDETSGIIGQHYRDGNNDVYFQIGSDNTTNGTDRFNQLRFNQDGTKFISTGNTAGTGSNQGFMAFGVADAGAGTINTAMLIGKGKVSIGVNPTYEETYNLNVNGTFNSTSTISCGTNIDALSGTITGGTIISNGDLYASSGTITGGTLVSTGDIKAEGNDIYGNFGSGGTAGIRFYSGGQYLYGTTSLGPDINNSTGNKIMEFGTGSGATTTFSGDIQINGNIIRNSQGYDRINFSTGSPITTITGDLYITGQLAADTTINGDLTVSGNNISSSSGTPITLSGDDITFADNATVSGDLTVNGSVNSDLSTNGVVQSNRQSGPMGVSDYIQITARNGGLTGYPSSSYPVLKTTYGALYFDVGGVYVGYLNTTVVNNIDFTGQHKAKPKEDSLYNNLNKYVGRIVSSTGEICSLVDISGGKSIPKTGKEGIDINEAIPVIELCDLNNDPKCCGVITAETDENNNGEKYFTQGAFTSVIHAPEEDRRLTINQVGEGAIWVCNVNGNIQNGDFITTCDIGEGGYGAKQADDLLHNYTCAKAMMKCTFLLDSPNYECVEIEDAGKTYRVALIACYYKF